VSFRWVNKDPNEVLDYSVDWSRWLGSATISTVLWYVDNENGIKTLIGNGQVVNGIQRVTATNTPVVATIHLALGTLNKEYKFYCYITDSTGSSAERVIKLNIKEQ
jgi:hypothetical protein